MEIGILFILSFICTSILFFECTKTGQKAINYIIKKIMK